MKPAYIKSMEWKNQQPISENFLETPVYYFTCKKASLLLAHRVRKARCCSVLKCSLACAMLTHYSPQAAAEEEDFEGCEPKRRVRDSREIRL